MTTDNRVRVVTRVRTVTSRLVEDVSKFGPKFASVPDLVTCDMRELVQRDEYERIDRRVRFGTDLDRPFSGRQGGGVGDRGVEFVDSTVPAHCDSRSGLGSAQRRRDAADPVIHFGNFRHNTVCFSTDVERNPCLRPARFRARCGECEERRDRDRRYRDCPRHFRSCVILQF